MAYLDQVAISVRKKRLRSSLLLVYASPRSSDGSWFLVDNVLIRRLSEMVDGLVVLDQPSGLVLSRFGPTLVQVRIPDEIEDSNLLVELVSDNMASDNMVSDNMSIEIMCVCALTDLPREQPEKPFGVGIDVARVQVSG